MDNLREVKESIVNLISRCEDFQELCETQMKMFKDRYSTNDIHNAVSHEYWRASKIRCSYEIKDLKELLQDIEDMQKEDVKQLDEAEEDIRINRHIGYLGI